MTENLSPAAPLHLGQLGDNTPLFKCISDLVQSYALGHLKYTVYGDTIFAEDTDGTAQWDIYLQNSLVVGRFTSEKGKVRTAKCKMNDSELAWVMTYLAKTPTVGIAYLTSAKAVGDWVLVPGWCKNSPFIFAYKPAERLYTVASYFQAGDVTYMAAPGASMWCPPTQEAPMDKIFSGFTDFVYKYGVTKTVIALLPWLNAIFEKRYVPIILGPMRSGKTSLARALTATWPQLSTRYVSLASTASVRNLLATRHVVADDVDEGVTKFDWTLIVAYFDRNAITRVSPDNLQLREFYLRGAFLMATNNPDLSLASISDRVMLIDATKFINGGVPPPPVEAPVDPGWLIAPILKFTIPSTLYSAIGYIRAIAAELNDPAKTLEPLKLYMKDLDPEVIFLAQLRRILSKTRAEGCRGARVRIINNEFYVAIRPERMYHPVSTGYVDFSFSEGVTNNAPMASQSVHVARKAYNIGQARWYLERHGIPYRSDYKYIYIKCDDIDKIIESLEAFKDISVGE